VLETQIELAHAVDETFAVGVRSEYPKFTPSMVSRPPWVLGKFGCLSYETTGESYVNACSIVPTREASVTEVEMSAPAPGACVQRTFVAVFQVDVRHWVFPSTAVGVYM
jgi:hypothetical protein